MEELRVRFPPSPTGYLHIGGARTALYNWLFARQNGGKLVLRIEDTDTERSTEASMQAILDGLKWMGIDWDEGPYLQSAFASEHRAAAETLIEKGAAYRCYCTKEELEAKRTAAMAAKQDFVGYDRTCLRLTAEERAAREAEGRPSVVRFKVPDSGGTVAFDDLVHGHTEVPLKDIDDFVVVRSTGEPLYILCNVVDDHRDRISHVIRGADHLINTPKQVLIYQAMGWAVPKFAHMALTMDPDKAKISKRKHGEVVAVQFYKEHGFLPWAFCNFMALLGWSPADGQELFLTRQELIDAFRMEGLSKSSSVFNYRPGDPKFFTDPKALHVNGQHLRLMPLADLAPLVETALRDAGIWQEAWAEGAAERAGFLATLDLIRARFHLLTDFATVGRAYFADDFAYDEKAFEKSIRKEAALKEYLPKLADRLAALDTFELATTEAALRALADELGVKAGLLINASRVAVTGQPAGPGLFDCLVAVGKERTCARLLRASQSI